MLNMSKHITRSIVLGLVGTTLAFAHPTDPGVGSPTHLSEMRQEKLAFVQYRIARAAAERDGVPSPTLADDEEMRQYRLFIEAIESVDRRLELPHLGLEFFHSVPTHTAKSGLAPLKPASDIDTVRDRYRTRISGGSSPDAE